MKKKWSELDPSLRSLASTHQAMCTVVLLHHESVMRMPGSKLFESESVSTYDSVLMWNTASKSAGGSLLASRRES